MTTNLLPPEYQQAAANLQKIITSRPLPSDGNSEQQFLNAQVSLSKGFNVRTWQADASEDVLQIKIKSADLLDSEKADAIGKMVYHALNEIEAVRGESVLLSPHEYLTQGKEQLAEFLRIAKTEGIPGSDVDYSKSVIFNPDLSRNQQQKYGAQIVESDNVTQVRINIPTNPENRDQAAALAKKVVEDLTRRLPEIKAQMIERIKKKNYIPNMTPEMEQQLQNHELKVISQQQGNWTSVFLDIRSPEQLQAQQNPGHIADAAALKKTNMLSQIPDDNSRFKIAARSVMFEGERLSKPASFFMEVAGTEDIKNGLGKLLYYLAKKKPELAEKITALTKENFFKSPEQWNLPEEKQEKFKQKAYASIDPDHPDEMKIKLNIGKGKAADIVAKIAGLTAAQIQMPQAAVVTSDGAKSPPILQMLVDKKAITPEQQQAALACSKEQNMLSGQAAVNLGFTTKETVDETLKEQALLRAAQASATSASPSIAEPVIQPQPDPMARQIKIAKGAIEKVLAAHNACPPTWAGKAEQTPASNALTL